MTKEYCVYIMTNKSRTRYKGLTGKYNIRYLVSYESTSSIHVALEREKQIEGWLRAKKFALINSMNPEWKDLSEEWFIK